MMQEKTSSETPLTETQARVLAAWWNGRYLIKSQPEGAVLVHGVKLPMALESEVAVIYFVEQVAFIKQG
jgi:hypothetical protein